MKNRCFVLMLVFLICIFLCSTAYAHDPQIIVRLDYSSKYVYSFGGLGSDSPSFQPNIEADWHNGLYVGTLGFMGFDGYNDGTDDEWNHYAGWHKNFKHLSLDLSYWYYQLYDLGEGSDDVHAFVGRFAWLSLSQTIPQVNKIENYIREITPYFYLEYNFPVKSSGPEKGYIWQVGLTFETNPKKIKTYFPLFFNISVNGTDGIDLKSGVTCTRIDMSIPIYEKHTKFGCFSISPNIHLMKINGDPDGDGKMFKRNIEFFYGLCFHYLF